MAQDLEGISALVTGASGGLGRAVSVALGLKGADVVGWGRDLDELTRTRDAVAACGGRFRSRVVDLTDPTMLADAIDKTVAEDSPGIVVNLTGGPAPGLVVDLGPDEWQSAFAAMVLPVITLTTGLLPAMRATGWGRVITCTSSGAIAPIPGLGLSNALRACLHGWAKTLANEVASDGVTSNVVVPGRIDTARVAELDRSRATASGVDVGQVRAASEATIPLGRYGDPSEFGNAVGFLAGREASYITGSVLRVDGGLIRSS